MIINWTPQVQATLTGENFATEIAGWTALSKEAETVAIDSNGYIFVGAENEVYRSKDNGDTWTKVLDAGGVSTTEYHLFVDSQDRIFSAVWVSGSDFDLYKGTDNGDTWTKVHDDIKKIWHMDETSDGTLYMNTYDSGVYRDYIWRSTDGDTWSVWYNVTDVLHNHVVAVNDYDDSQIYMATGDNATTGEQTYRYYNGTGWTTLVTGKTATAIWFDSQYVYFGADGHFINWRLPHGETDWSKKEVFFDLYPHCDTTNFVFDGCRIGDIMLFGTEDGQLWGSWDGLRWVKLQDFGDSGSIFRFTRSRPIYFTERTGGKLYRLDVTKEDLIQLYYAKYNTERGSLSNTATYVREERVSNDTSYLDLTSVGLSNVQASIKGLAKRNFVLHQANIANAGWEWNNETGWYVRKGAGTYGTGSVTSEDKANGTYSLKYEKLSGDSYNGAIQPYDGAYATVALDRGSVLLISAYIKGNVSSDNRFQIIILNHSSGIPVANPTFNLTTSWQRISTYYVCKVDSITVRPSFEFVKGISYVTYFDSILQQTLECGIAYEEGDANEAIHYVEQYSPHLFFTSDLQTINATLTVNGEQVSHSGTLANGSESSATSLTGILTGAVQVSANIQGSGQAIFKINGTRLLYEDSMIAKGRTIEMYYGRYYGTFLPTINTTDLIVVTNLASNVTIVSHVVNKLTLNVTAFLNTTVKIYCAEKGKPVTISGAITWSYNSTNKICTVNGTGTHQINVFWQPSNVYTTEVIVGTVIVASTSVLVAWWYRRKKKTRTVSV